MKNINPLLLCFLLICSAQQLFGQSLKGFNYQAVARDNAGAILVNTSVTLRFQIHQGTTTGTVIYQEVHNLTTNQFGLIQASIGKGILEAGDFSTIDWNGDDFFLAVQLNGNAIDVTPFESVPYAKMATSMTLEDLTNVAQLSPAAGQILKWSGTEWEPQDMINYAAGTGIDITGSTISNTAPDQVVQITGSGATAVSGTYPNFNISSTDNVNDADASTTNEIQSISLIGNTLGLSLGGGSVNLAPFASPWNVSGSNLFFNTGNVGIGDNSPLSTLTVGNGDKLRMNGNDGDILLTDDQGTIQFARTSDADNAPMIEMFPSGTNNSTRMLFAHSPGFRNWGLQYNDTLDAFTWIGNNVPVMHLQLAGRKIGIGNVNPQAKLHISDNSGVGVGQLKLTETELDYSRITLNNDVKDAYWDIAARSDTNLANAQIHFYQSVAGNIFTIRGNKRVGINDSSPSYALDINGAGQTRSINIANDLPTTSSSISNYGLYCNLTQAGNNGFPRLYNIYGVSTDVDAYLSYGVYGRASNATNFNYGVIGVASTTGGYAVYASGNAYTTGSYLPSDAKLKSGIRPFREGLASIMKLQPKMYTYDTRQYDFMNLPEGRQYGFLAQDVEELFPNLIKQSFQAYEEPLSDTPEGQGIEFKAINYTAFIPVIVSAMQEQQEVIEKQQEKIQSLEERLAALEAIIKNK